MNKMPAWAMASCLLIGLLCLYGLSFRHRVEASNRAVGLAADMTSLVELAQQANRPLPEFLAEMKEAGLTGVVLQEETVGDLATAGRIRIDTYNGATSLYGENERTLKFARTRFGMKLAWPTGIGATRVQASPDAILRLSLGLNSSLAKLAQEAGLEVIARHGNDLGMNAASISLLLKSSSEMGSRWFLPSGDQVIGRRELTETTETVLARHDYVYLTPEFTKLSGDSQLRAKLKDRTLRLHAVQAAEADRLNEGALVERFVKAFRERGMRWLLIRPLSQANEAPGMGLKRILAAVKSGVAHEGGQVKVPHVWEEPATPSWLFLAIPLAACPLLIWAGMAMISVGWLRWMGGGIVLALALACLKESARPYFALAASIGFPTAAYLWLVGQQRVNSAVAYLVMTLISLVGGLVVASTLVGIDWTLQNEVFVGVKPSHYLPLILAGIVLLHKLTDFKSAMSQPILWGSAMLSVVILASVLLMLARTGNDAPAAVSPLELQFRSLLDQILYTRPRTKEFLIGHPALIVGLMLWGASDRNPQWKPAAAILLTIGAIGLTSIVNTLCHLHSPLDLALARIGIGWVIGGILGAAMGAVLMKLLNRRKGESA